MVGVETIINRFGPEFRATDQFIHLVAYLSEVLAGKLVRGLERLDPYSSRCEVEDGWTR